MVIPAGRHDERETHRKKPFLRLEYDDAKQRQRIKVPLRALALFSFSLFALFKQRLTKMRDRTRLSLTEHLSFCFFLSRSLNEVGRNSNPFLLVTINYTWDTSICTTTQPHKQFL